MAKKNSPILFESSQRSFQEENFYLCTFVSFSEMDIICNRRWLALFWWIVNECEHGVCCVSSSFASLNFILRCDREFEPFDTPLAVFDVFSFCNIARLCFRSLVFWVFAADFNRRKCDRWLAVLWISFISCKSSVITLSIVFASERKFFFHVDSGSNRTFVYIHIFKFEYIYLHGNFDFAIIEAKSRSRLV